LALALVGAPQDQVQSENDGRRKGSGSSGYGPTLECGNRAALGMGAIGGAGVSGDALILGTASDLTVTKNDINTETGTKAVVVSPQCIGTCARIEANITGNHG
jgi:hypothetical protein